VPYEDTVGAFVELQQAGKVRHIGVSNVSAEQLELARSLCDVVSVQNKYNPVERASEEILAICEREGIVFIPWQPILLDPASTLDQIAAEHGAVRQQIALAWLLRRSPVMLPIPGTSDIGHLDANVDAAWLQLTASDVDRLSDVAA
jgi:aryl-alcohol dehydrogenase-like predicted oxidoreductase